ncbi:PXMP2/4 family protein 4 [Glycine soja]
MSYGGTLCPHAHKFLLLPIAVKTPLAFNNFKLSLRSTLSPFLSTSTTPPRPSNPPSPSSPPSPTTAPAEAAHVAAVAVAVAEALTVRIPAAEAMEETSSPSCHDLTWFYYRYLALLGKHPVAVKALTSAILNLIGDLLCELVIDKVPSLDFKRTFVFTFLGFALVGPTLHFWYLYLSKLVTLPGASGALLRLVLDQFLFSPIFSGVFLSTLVTLEGSPSQAVPKLKQVGVNSIV